MSLLIKQTVDEWLNQVDYSELNDGSYVPSQFALSFMNFVKLVNGAEGEENKTPVVHLKMLDQIGGTKENIANLVFRGAAKTTLFFEYLAPYIGVFGEIPGFGVVDGMIYVSDSMDNGVKSARKNIQFRYDHSDFLRHYIPNVSFTDNYIEMENREGKLLGIKMFGAKTGIRGTKIFGKRPTLCVLDDLVSDDDAKSKASMQAIKDTVYKGVNYALHPTKRKIIFNGTPFTKDDILYEAVESGGWHVNVWPVCEKFPCEEHEFRGAWDDRFPYKAVKAQYDLAVATGKISAFMQELMLRITSDEERLVQDSEIQWYSRAQLLENKHRFNFYMTTDWAVSDKQTADYGVQSVWGYNSNKDWFLVDGQMTREDMGKQVDKLFRHVQTYRPQTVGVEISGQQKGFIPLLQKEMLSRNIWFSFAQGPTGELGLRPVMNKLARFNMIVPQFKMKKIYFPEEMKDSIFVQEMLNQIRMTTISGIKSKNDDCLDTVSMLADMNPWVPEDVVKMSQTESGIYGIDEEEDTDSGLSSYIV